MIELRKRAVKTHSLDRLLAFLPSTGRYQSLLYANPLHPPSMNPSKDSKSGVNRIIYVNRPLLRLLGIWPPTARSNDMVTRVLRILLILFHFMMIFFVIVPTFLYMYLVVQNATGVLKLMPSFLFVVMAVGKYGNLVSRVDKIGLCLKYVEDDWRFAVNVDTRDLMERHAKIGKRLFLTCATFMYGGGITYRVFIPLTKGKHVNEQNITIRSLPCPGYFVMFDTITSPGYEITYFLQVVSGLVTYSITTAGCGIASLFVMHACGQLEILESLMRDIVDEDKFLNRKTNESLVVSIEQQTRIHNFLRLVDDILQQFCLIEIMGSTMVLCMFGYILITEWHNQNASIAFMYFLTLAPLICNMFLFCYIGEKLSLQAEKVAMTSRVLEWYRLPNETARSIVLIMAMANSGAKLSAGNMIDLSLRTFGNIMKTAVTYCNMLRTLA